MTITRRLKIGFVCFVILFLMLEGAAVGLTVWLQSWSTDSTSSATQVNAASEIQLQIADTVAHGLTATGLDSGAQYYVDGVQSDTDASFALISDNLDLLDQTVDSDEKAEVAEIRNLVSQYKEDFDQALALAAAGSAQARAKLNESKLILADLQGATASFREQKLAEEEELMAAVSGNASVVMWLIVGLASLGVFAGIGAAWYIPRIISRQLQGAFTRLSSSAAELLAVATQVSSSAAQTAASTNETTATVEEVKQTAMLAKEKSSQAAEGATGAVGNMGSVRELTEETASGIERMQSQMDTVFSTINTLSERAQEAGDIVASVNDLAEQSNLLSVNASIEAAKAGEYGKGFTVVAQEVKSLAEQSKQAVAQVRTMLGEIQKASQTAVEAATQSREAVEAGREKSVQAGEALQRVADGAGDDAALMQQASASAQQQLAGMEQIAQAIDSINQAGEQSAAGTRQVQQEVSHLQELATELKLLVERKTEAEATAPDSEPA